MRDVSPELPRREEIEEVLRLVHEEASRYLAGVDDRPVRSALQARLRFAGHRVPTRASRAATPASKTRPSPSKRGS